MRFGSILIIIKLQQQNEMLRNIRLSTCINMLANSQTVSIHVPLDGASLPIQDEEYPTCKDIPLANFEAEIDEKHIRR